MEINQAVRACVKECKLFQTEDMHDMQQDVANLYAKIFEFLTEMMKWYKTKGKKRFLSSFNEALYDGFQSRLSEIKELSALITRAFSHKV